MDKLDEPEEFDLAALMEEASHGVNKLAVARDHVHGLMGGYAEASLAYGEAGNVPVANLLVMVADDFHTVWHLIDNAMHDLNDEDEEDMHDDSHEDH